VEVRGRSRSLTINYRTSHQIRRQADRLLDPEVADVDGNVETRKGTISVFNGPAPVIQECPSEAAEAAAVADWLQERQREGVPPQEMAIFVRAEAQLDRARAAAEQAGLACVVLDDRVESARAAASISVMHLAKGLEFRVVAVMACDDVVLPLQERIELVSDSSDLEEVYKTERHLLYVACTRARDQLHISGVDPTSEFLQDFTG
jgi:superfamily I DNA/RNA helicase